MNVCVKTFTFQGENVRYNVWKKWPLLLDCFVKWSIKYGTLQIFDFNEVQEVKTIADFLQ